MAEFKNLSALLEDTSTDALVAALVAMDQAEGFDSDDSDFNTAICVMLELRYPEASQRVAALFLDEPEEAGRYIEEHTYSQILIAALVKLGIVA